MQKPRAYVAYYRVSTARQGSSGLGIDAQERAVNDHLTNAGGELLATFTEFESGKRADRAKLIEAISACRLRKATLIFAKLDRLSRNVAFVSALMDAGVDFVAADFPQANRLTIHILAAVAEHEAHLISERTKAALAAARARGTHLGGFRGRVASDTDRARGRAVRSALAASRAADLRPTILSLREAGIKSYTGLARALNKRGITAARGGLWSAIQARRVCQRFTIEQL